jgi:hypothetical protein
MAVSAEQRARDHERAAHARAALAAKHFPTPEAKSAYFQRLGRLSNAGRVVLRAEEAAALRDAYALLRTIADRLPDPSESAT